MIASVAWWQWLVAAAMFLVIVLGGMAFLGGASRISTRERIDPEDVQDLDVYFVCAECGTELQVTRLGEIQVPRHCGDPMGVERRPRTGASG